MNYKGEPGSEEWWNDVIRRLDIVRVLIIMFIIGMVGLVLIVIGTVGLAHSAVVIQLTNDTYQVPDNWTGCFVNPNDLQDTTFGCPGPVGSPDDYKNRPVVSEITMTFGNGTTKVFTFNKTIHDCIDQYFGEDYGNKYENSTVDCGKVLG